MEVIKKVEELDKKIENISSERYKFIEECLYGLTSEKLKKYNILNKAFGTSKSGHLTKSFIEFIIKKEFPSKTRFIILKSRRKSNKIKYKNKRMNPSFYLKRLKIWDYTPNQKYFIIFPVRRFTVKRIENLKVVEWETAKTIFSSIKRCLPLFLENSTKGKITQLKRKYEDLTGTHINDKDIREKV